MSSPPSTKPQCSHCASNNRCLLHPVVLRGIHRLLCTSCVLLLHPSSFCPSCFQFFHHPLSSTSSASAHRFLSCIKCSSLTHIHCLPSPPPSPSSFLCPPCSSPSSFSFSFFSLPLLHKNLALVLLCAANISSASINKARALANAKADRSVREAALARNRAKEALRHFSQLHKVRPTQGSFHVSASRNLATKAKHKLLIKPHDPASSVTSKDFHDKNDAPDSFRGNGTTSVEDKSRNYGAVVDANST